ncbi:MAG: DNA repair protein RecO [Clostridia bacterium]|nr:DNA repair protein RecO [Clostridia bacterium]
MEVKYNALMLRAADYKDNDKILTLFAAGKGKITATCRGVKKAAAKLKFAAQPFCFAEYVLAERAGRYTVISAFLHDGFYALREDIQKFYAASAVLETCNLLLPEGLQSDGLFLCAVQTLGRMCEEDEGLPLLTFLLNALSFAGYTLRLDGCANCGKPLSGRGYFSFTSGSFFCGECPGEGYVPASEVTYHTLRIAAGLENSALTQEGVKRALRLLKEYFLQKTECKAESLSEYIRLL